MADRMDAEGPVGYQAVEFLDIPPMEQSLADPPTQEPYRDVVRSSARSRSTRFDER